MFVRQEAAAAAHSADSASQRTKTGQCEARYTVCISITFITPELHPIQTVLSWEVRENWMIYWEVHFLFNLGRNKGKHLIKENSCVWFIHYPQDFLLLLLTYMAHRGQIPKLEMLIAPRHPSTQPVGPRMFKRPMEPGAISSSPGLTCRSTVV